MAADDRVLPEPLRPDPGEVGLLTDFDHLRQRIDRAWELFESVLPDVDLRAETRSRGRPARDLIVPVGAWPDARGIHRMIADARAGATSTESESAASARLRAAHRDAPDSAVLEAFHTAADHVRQWLASAAAPDESRLVGPSPLGPVPIGTMIHAATFQLAVIARDLRPAGAPELPELDALAVVALVDSSGAVAARLDATASIAAVSPQVAAGTGTVRRSWRTLVADDDHAHLGPAVLGPAGLLVDIAAGRIDLIELARRLRVRDGRGLVAMAVVLDGIPDLPAAGVLRRAGGALRLGGLRR